jgi:hypothetical protein
VKPSFRIIAGAAALSAMSLSLSACDTSPYAARVNSQVIKQTALNAELRTWAGNSGYVSAFDSGNSSSSGGSGVTVRGNASGTYNSSWVSEVLGSIIEAAIIHQHLVAIGKLPDQALLDAARSVSETSAAEWVDFPSSFRQTLVERLAERAADSPTRLPLATLQTTYQQYVQYFFVQVCLQQSTATTQAAAQVISGSGDANGAAVCYDQSQLENFPAAYRTAVIGLAVGQVSQPIPTSDGFDVVKVVSRQEQGLNPAVQSVLSVVLNSSQGVPDSTLAQLTKVARVQVNPAYGTWSSSAGVTPPQISSS